MKRDGVALLDWQVWTERSKLCTLLLTKIPKKPVPPKREERPFPSAAEAQKALEEFVANLRSQGFVPEEAIFGQLDVSSAAVQADETASKAWGKVARPTWLARLPEPLAKQHKRAMRLVETARLGHRAADIESLMRVGIALQLKTVKPSAVVSVVTRFGGDPDLPAGFTWPGKKGAPLAFLAQFRLDELSSLDLEKRLPARGLLSIFAQLNAEHDEYAELVKVFYFDAPQKLARTAPKHDAETDRRPSKVCTATASGRITLPGPEELATATLRLNDQERERYGDDVFNEVRPENSAHQLLGWGSATSEHAHLKGWELLAQVDSDDKLGLEIGDVETLRIHIDSKKLAARDFGTVKATAGEE